MSARNLDDVHSALQEVERLVNFNNLHAAGFVSYEAAPAFDSALRVLAAGDFPLLWFGLYSEPHIIQASEIFKDPGGSAVDLDWVPSIERESYNDAIDKIKDHIALGRTYQVNYTMRLNAEFNGIEWDFFQHLAQSQNKYAASVSYTHLTLPTSDLV